MLMPLGNELGKFSVNITSLKQTELSGGQIKVEMDTVGEASGQGYGGAKRRRGSKVHISVDTLGHLLALVVPPANAQDWAQVTALTLEVVKLPQAKKGFMLLPKAWVVEQSFVWVARFRRLARDYERLPETLAVCIS
jgi:transposase